MSERDRRWRVRRVSGLLWPGFTKRLGATEGMTYLWGVPIGRFQVVGGPGEATQLRYVRWPVVDVLYAEPLHAHHAIDAAGYVRLPRGRRVRFCRFRLELHESD